MNASLVCLVAALSTAPPEGDWTAVETPSTDFAAAVRGQNPNGQPYEEFPYQYEEVPGGSAPTSPSAPSTVAPSGGAPVTPYQQPSQPYDPFLGQAPVGPRPMPGHSGGPTFGANGPQPYRLGWTPRLSAGLLPDVSTERGLGNFGVFELDTALQKAERWPWCGAIKSFTQEFNLRLWDGPESTPGLATALPGQVFRFGWDFELATPANHPWSLQVGFNPSINSDFEDNLTSDAWNWDGRGILYFRPSPHLMWAFGAGYWDRVNDKVIPYAGFVWTPDDRWEWRILFPRSRVSYFLGTPWGFSSWLYARGEYHIEAYQIELETTGAREKVEIEDWRILLGVRTDNGWVAGFLEAGWVFGRNVAFLHGTPGFDPTTGFIARAGLRF